jgi:hypothetical protein
MEGLVKEGSEVMEEDFVLPQLEVERAFLR